MQENFILLQQSLKYKFKVCITIITRVSMQLTPRLVLSKTFYVFPFQSGSVPGHFPSTPGK